MLRPSAYAMEIPQTASSPVATHVKCHPPANVATQAAKGGPMNCPVDRHCCNKPTDVDEA